MEVAGGTLYDPQVEDDSIPHKLAYIEGFL